MNATKTANRRAHVRLASPGVASHLQTIDTSMPAAVENISMGGMFVRCAAPLASGTRLLVRVVKPGLKRAIELHASVASVVTPTEARLRGLVAGLGLRIDPADAESARRLREILATLAAQADETSVETAPPCPAPKAAPSTPAIAAEASERERQVRALEEEVANLRRELLRRGRTIVDQENRIRALEAASRSPGATRAA